MRCIWFDGVARRFTGDLVSVFAESGDCFTGEEDIEDAGVGLEALDDVDENDFMELPDVDLEDEADEADSDRLAELPELEDANKYVEDPYRDEGCFGPLDR